MMKRTGSLLALCTVGLIGLAATQAAADCRSKAASKAASMYSSAANEFLKCSKAIAGGKLCSKPLRDAKVQSKLSKTQASLLSPCAAPAPATFGFGSADALAIRVAGVATGEGRQIVDSVFGRDASLMSANQLKCASLIAKQVKSAGKKYIKTLMTCGQFCSALDQMTANSAFDSATT